MSRWAPDAKDRLQRVAIELYADQGFEKTTVAEIASGAGLTERTFFRYFADKREVLFAGAREFQSLLVDAVNDAASTLTPLRAIASAFESIGPFFEQRRAGVEMRQSVIDSNSELQERELIKMASLALGLAEALRNRGVEEQEATLVSEVGVVAFRVAFNTWLQPKHRGDLTHAIRETFANLEAVTSST